MKKLNYFLIFWFSLLGIAGSAAVISPLPYTLSNGQTIDAVPVQSNFNWIVNQVNSNAASLSTTPTIVQVQNSSTQLLSSVSGTNTITATANPTINSYVAGQVFRFIPANSNTANATININAVGAANIVLRNSTELPAATLTAGNPCTIFYNGTNFVLLNNENFVSAISFGATADFSTDNTTLIQNAVNAFGANGGTLVIPKGVKWDYSNVSFSLPNEVTVLDYSGWDWKNSDWTGQVKTITKTASPGSKNANEYQLIADYHPAYVCDNTSGGSDYRCSFVWRRDGNTDWQLTTDQPTAPGTERRIQFSFYGMYAGVNYPGGTNVFGIDPYDGSFGFNSIAQVGVDYTFFQASNRTFINQLKATVANGWDVQYKNATNGLILRQSISGTDGNFYYTINGNQSDFHTANSEVYGNRIFVAPKTNNYTLTAQDSGKTFTNYNSPGGETFTLPPAVTGLNYRFSVRASQNMRIDPDGLEYFIGYQAGSAVSTKAAGKYMESTLIGSILEITCSEAGVWDFIRYGVWTDQP